MKGKLSPLTALALLACVGCAAEVLSVEEATGACLPTPYSAYELTLFAARDEGCGACVDGACEVVERRCLCAGPRDGSGAQIVEDLQGERFEDVGAGNLCLRLVGRDLAGPDPGSAEECDCEPVRASAASWCALAVLPEPAVLMRSCQGSAAFAGCMSLDP